MRQSSLTVNKDACSLYACSPRDRGVPCVNVVIGVVLGELLAVRVVPVVVCDDAVVRRTLVLIAFTVAIVFIVAISRRILLYWRYSVYTPVGDSKLLLPNFEL